MDLLAQASTGSGLESLLIPAILIVGMYVLLIRPQRARQRAQQAMLDDLAVGDEVMTAGGLFGRVTRIDAESGRVTLRIAAGVEVEVLRIAVRERIAPLTPEP
ncbi:MAG: preprotein translocase subunit YajC [Actinomycetota bacterium]